MPTETLFASALALPPHERSAYLLRACADDADNEDLLQSGLETMRRRLLAEAPPRPSKRIDTLSVRLQRGPKPTPIPPHLERPERVRGDLDWIVMRCLEKDKERRYQSVAELAADLHRLLRKEPIAARAPSSMYLLRKFAERHRHGVLAASLALCALIAATAVSTCKRSVRSAPKGSRRKPSMASSASSTSPIRSRARGRRSQPMSC